MEEEDLALAYGDKNLVSIATGKQQPLNTAPSVATVITARDIAAIGALEVDDVLRAVPGLYVSRTTGRNASLLLMRGIGSGSPVTAQVLVLLNGVPFNNMYQGDKVPSWRGYSVDNISRIEVIRGPGSALYGADAYAGVINIITKSAAEIDGTEAGVRAGSFNTWDSWVQHGGKMGPVDVAGYLRVGGSEGFKRTINADAQTRNDVRFNTHASLAPGSSDNGYEAIDGNLNLSYDKWRLRSNYQQRNQLGFGSGTNSALVTSAEAKAESILSELSWNDAEFAQDWGAGFSASYHHFAYTFPDNLMLLPPGATLIYPTRPLPTTVTFPAGQIGGPNQWERNYRISAFANYTGFSGHNLRFGVGHDNLSLYKATTYKNFFIGPGGVLTAYPTVRDFTAIQPHIRPHDREVSYAYIQDEWQFTKDWTLTAGIRRDMYSDFGGTTNPRAALVWEATYDLTAKLMYGRAFRAPAFIELYGINPVANGNPALQPETIQTLEAALSWKPQSNAEINLNVFKYTMKDIIRLVPNTNTYQNSGIQDGQGMELEGIWDISRDWRLTSHYAYQHSLSRSANRDPGYAPHHTVYARADWLMATGWQLSTQLNAIFDRNRAFGDTRPPIRDYSTVDLTLRSTPAKDKWAFAVSVRNLFNADVREPSFYTAAPATNPTLPTSLIPGDLPQAGRNFWLQATYRM
ncbi:MAG TPA: TonB-dependent receptor [Rhodocyclaceae bacterium]|nr:TonB-dependent receptor [Rhodocyclaceae bacterium]